MSDSILERFILEYIKTPEKQWPDETYFHQRNRFKVQRSWDQVLEDHDLTPERAVGKYVELLEARARTGVSTIYAMSNGGSGSHYLGELLGEVGNFHLTDEVYFPPRLLDRLENLDQATSSMMLDFIDVLHTGRIDSGLADTTIVNIGHLRPDARPQLLRSLGVRGHFLLLLRNPFDVAISRAFRKEEYRSAVAATDDDSAYLTQQARYCAGFLRRAGLERWDSVCRYERLINEPIAALRDVLLTIGTPFDHALVESALDKYDAKRSGPASRSGNLNLAPRTPIATQHAQILNEELASPANQYGYSAPQQIKASLTT